MQRQLSSLLRSTALTSAHPCNRVTELHSAWSEWLRTSPPSWRVVGVHLGHDSALSIVENGTVKIVLEVERLFDVRYFRFSPDPSTLADQLQAAIAAIQMFMPPPQGIEQFDFGVRTRISAVDMRSQFVPSQLDVDAIVRNWLPAKRWILANHHFSHAFLAYFESDLVPSLVVSYDGGGNDGHFVCWEAAFESPSSLLWSPIVLSDIRLPNLGDRYAAIGQTNVPEVKSSEILAVAGKLMALAALGTPHAGFVAVLREWMHYNNSAKLPDQTPTEEFSQIDSYRMVAASTQKAFEELALELISTALARVSFVVESIVLTGGCALNVIVNDLTAQRFGLPVHIPASPNDGMPFIPTVAAVYCARAFTE